MLTKNNFHSKKFGWIEYGLERSSSKQQVNFV